MQTDLKTQLTQYLNEGKQLELTWDGGGDEVFFHLSIDGKELSDEHALSRMLEEYLVEYSPISGVGEFTLEGTGRLALQHEKIILIHQSTIHQVEDYDEESGEPIQGDAHELEEETFVLFAE